MTNKQVIPDCQRSSAQVVPLREQVARAISRNCDRAIEDQADAAIAAVYAALLEMELPEEALRASRAYWPEPDPERGVLKGIFREIIRSLANQGGK